jgi:hypothetical protein
MFGKKITNIKTCVAGALSFLAPYRTLPFPPFHWQEQEEMLNGKCRQGRGWKQV